MTPAVRTRDGSRQHLHAVLRSAVVRPTVDNYRRLIAGESRRPFAAWTWMLAGALVAGVVLAWGRLASDTALAPADGLLALAIGAFACLAVAVWAAYAGLCHVLARALRGEGAFRELVFLAAAFSTPLLVASSALSLVPAARRLAVGLYLYWLVLHVVAIRAAYGLSAIRAAIAAALALALLGAILGGLLVAGMLAL
jgi:hypothetical protein